MDGKDPDTYVVEIKGPHGVKQVELPAEQVRFFGQEYNSEYAAALFLASCELYMAGHGRGN